LPTELKKGLYKRSWERASIKFRKAKKFGTTPLGAQEGKNKNKRPHEKSCGLIVFMLASAIRLLPLTANF
jgi:hypothetical protein